MFISVDLPAPFSPRRACTSPARTSKSTRSFATTPGKRLVIPRTSRTGASAAIARDSTGVGGGPPPSRVLRLELDDGLDLDLPGRDLLADRDRLRDERLRHLRADGAEADAAVLQAVEHVGAALELARLRLGRQVLDGLVDPLQGARQHVRPEVELVGVDAPDVVLLRRREGAEATAARDLEDDLRALLDLRQRRLVALRLVVEGR